MMASQPKPRGNDHRAPSRAPANESETIFLNGIAQDPTNDYTIVGRTFTMTSAPASTDQLGASYFTGSLGGYHRMETPNPAVNGTATVFTMTHVPVTNTAGVFLNGVAQDPGKDYSISGMTITYSVAPASTDKLRVSYFDSAVGMPSGVSETGMESPTPAVDGATRMFSFTGQSGTETVYLNGIALRPGPGNDYIISGTVLTQAVPPAATDVLLVDAYSGWTPTFGSLTKWYQDLADGRILGRLVGGAVTEYGTDALGSVTSYRNGETGVLGNVNRFKPYGETLGGIGSQASGPYQFVGSGGYQGILRTFASTSLPYRIYDSGTGRFNNSDPIGLEGGDNQFQYVEANPTNRVDIRGLQSGMPPLDSHGAVNFNELLGRIFAPDIRSVEESAHEVSQMPDIYAQQEAYEIWRSTALAGSKPWQALLDQWFFEVGGSKFLSVGDTPYNRSIRSNAGFQKMFNCFVQYHCGSARQKDFVRRQLTQVDPGNTINDSGFHWHYLFLVHGPSEPLTPGRADAYTAATHFLGSYNAKITGKCPSRYGPASFHVLISNMSGLASGSRLPWNPSHHVYPNHLRGEGPYKPSRGGNLDEYFVFNQDFDTRKLSSGPPPCRLP
jgi:RHS repeat-associated protein